ncbi:glycoside hydrolase family 78 protein [Aliifodinibius sp. S!AR15-10]|uniref:family 78 glycoside hydrolase catalytic domain n=1 Tax=Aliifodinibius sp. S!AR15-10 TaxID=2950437 RepID=UPI002861FE69|nr:family 78 glycoside hydrolase catalytic domain [Aliifodinibius sp. S!AR15-10]MDR8392710.1 glycoside hydrolase family 78 protein [Aliifodinibius sp. S!AR15-10]
MLNRIYKGCIAVFLGMLIASCQQSGMHVPTDLKIEYLTNPVGLDVEKPRFSWILDDERRGAQQTAYHIVVSKDREEVQDGTGSVWDTGKISSSETVNIEYDGEGLESGETYFWSVRTWDGEEEASDWSRVHSFQMGLLNPEEWEAQWITHPDSAVVSPLLRNDFSIDKEIASAKLYVTGVGYYEVYLNGEKVGDHVLDPAITDYNDRVLYETYDVTDRLNSGQNAWGLWLGEGAWRLKRREDRWAWYGTDNNFGKPMGIAQLHIRFSDGSETVMTTDESWTATSGPITYSSVYGGEDYDARLEQEGWNTTGFDDSSWEQVEAVEKPGITLDSQTMPPIRVTQTIKPVTRTEPEPGTYLFDLGQNIPGWWRIQVEGETGTELTIRGAETLNDSLFPTLLKPGDSLSTDKVYHRDVWTTYTLKGDGSESYEPRFFYTGFRYVEVKADNPQQLNSLKVSGRVVHSDIPRNGHFVSSDTLLNDIYQAAIWSQWGNLHGYPTDCPHREKGGYNGDGQVIAEASMHDFHMQPFYRKWIRDMRDSQYENGRIPNTSPTMLGGTGGGIAWGSAYILIPWWMHQYYGDEGILAEHYPAMKRYMQYLQNLASEDDEHPEEEYIINEFGGHWDSLGEWEAPVRERNGPVNPLTNTYYWYLDSITFAKIAEILGEEQDRAHFLALADSIKQAFNEKFFNPQTNLYGTEEPYQSYLLFALSGDLVPEDHRQAVLDNLIEDIMVTSDGHLGTGILGTKHLFSTLTNEGREDVIHRMATQRTFPSWGYWIENGATTLWENWKGESSHNHQMFGSINEYFYKYLAGIRAPTDTGTTKGYKQIHIKPFIPGDLTHAEASLQTVRGSVSSSWQLLNEEFQLDITIPPNTSGKVHIPDLGHEEVTVSESGSIIWDSNGSPEDIENIINGTRKNGYVTFDIGAGSYSFTLSPAM